MGFDIYGENLRAGHCEVHPHVHEEFPCSVCLAERKSYDQQQGQYSYNELAQASHINQLETKIAELEARQREEYKRGIVDGVRFAASRLAPDGNTDSLLAKALVAHVPLPEPPTTQEQENE